MGPVTYTERIEDFFNSIVGVIVLLSNLMGKLDFLKKLPFSLMYLSDSNISKMTLLGNKLYYLLLK